MIDSGKTTASEKTAANHPNRSTAIQKVQTVPEEVCDAIATVSRAAEKCAWLAKRAYESGDVDEACYLSVLKDGLFRVKARALDAVTAPSDDIEVHELPGARFPLLYLEVRTETGERRGFRLTPGDVQGRTVVDRVQIQDYESVEPDAVEGPVLEAALERLKQEGIDFASCLQESIESKKKKLRSVPEGTVPPEIDSVSLGVYVDWIAREADRE